MERRKLEELNVLDDFLFQEMITRGEKGENFCRILLSTILGVNIRNVKVVPQKNILGVSPSRHGIKVDAYIEAVADDNEKKTADAEVLPDIYDIEPNKYQTKNEAKRTRYYHSLIDAKILKSGIDYEKLKNVVIIMILPYDPFGKNRMMYTFETHCKEDNSIEYDDGIKTIYLYTKGKEGYLGKGLVDMLKYVEDSREENATNEELRQIHYLVDEIRRDKEVDISYMKSWEWEAMIREEGVHQGIAEGETLKLISQIRKKNEKKMSVQEIADILEEDIILIKKIQQIIRENPNWNDKEVYDNYVGKNSNKFVVHKLQ